MKTKGFLFTTAASVLLSVALSADQPYNLDQLPEDCALAAAPRALQTFRWLDCAPEPRSVWASSERPRDPDVLTTPRGLQQMPRLAHATTIAREPARRIVLASNGRPSVSPRACGTSRFARRRAARPRAAATRPHAAVSSTSASRSCPVRRSRPPFRTAPPRREASPRSPRARTSKPRTRQGRAARCGRRPSFGSGFDTLSGGD